MSGLEVAPALNALHFAGIDMFLGCDDISTDGSLFYCYTIMS